MLLLTNLNSRFSKLAFSAGDGFHPVIAKRYPMFGMYTILQVVTEAGRCFFISSAPIRVRVSGKVLFTWRTVFRYTTTIEQSDVYRIMITRKLYYRYIKLKMKEIEISLQLSKCESTFARTMKSFSDLFALKSTMYSIKYLT